MRARSQGSSSGSLQEDAEGVVKAGRRESARLLWLRAAAATKLTPRGIGSPARAMRAAAARAAAADAGDDVELAELRGRDLAPLLGRRSSGGVPQASPSRHAVPVHAAAAVVGPTGGWRVAGKALLLGSKLNVLLLAVPFAMLAAGTHWGDGWVFFFALAGLCPLAERLGFITEQLAQYTNSTVGGLLNASFGNATEVIVSIACLRARLLRVVQLSLLGSVLSNMLLVLGCAFIAGGVKYKEQRFNSTGVGVNVSLLLLAVVAQALPALLAGTDSELHGTASTLALSRFISFVLLGVYFAFLYFQLVTHRELYDDDATAAGGDDADDPDAAGAAGDASALAAPPDAEEVKDDDEDELVLTFRGALVCLAVVTVIIAVLSEYLASAIEGAAHSWGLPLSFISTILLPIVGNAAEHASAVIFAMHNKMDLAIGIAVGSSTQISLLVTPGCVLLAGCMRRPLDLDLGPFETGALLVSVLMLAFGVQGGRTNWLKGVALVASYLVLAAAFAAHGDPRLQAEQDEAEGR